jgi:2,5-diketo-D-gluconate reductase A
MIEAERPDMKAVTLRRGAAVPIVGFGTWQIKGRAARDAASIALEVGYRHLDTATVYGNEREIGRALADSALARSEVFITTKLPGNSTGVRRTIEQSLSDLGVDSVDLWLIHWPPAQSYEQTSNRSGELFQQMLTLRDEGLAGAVGVSNYSIDEIDQLIGTVGEAPEVNQIPWGPYRHNPSLRRQLETRGVCLEGYSPLQTSRLDDPAIVAIAARHGVSAAQVVLRWHVQHGIVVIPKSTHRSRIRENFEIMSVVLDAGEMRTLDELTPARPGPS